MHSHVMETLEYHDVKSTPIYTYLVNLESDDYHVKASKSLEQDEDLLRLDLSKSRSVTMPKSLGDSSERYPKSSREPAN